MPRLPAGIRSAYRVKVGVNYGRENVRHEPGEIVDDLPAADVADLLALGAIEPVAASGEEVTE